MRVWTNGRRTALLRCESLLLLTTMSVDGVPALPNELWELVFALVKADQDLESLFTRIGEYYREIE